MTQYHKVREYKPEDDTKFAEALKSVHELITKNNSNSQNIVVFLSDGEDNGWPVEPIVKNIVFEFPKTIIYTIQFGNDTDNSSPLQIISTAGNGLFLQAKNSTELTDAFDIIGVLHE